MFGYGQQLALNHMNYKVKSLTKEQILRTCCTSNTTIKCFANLRVLTKQYNQELTVISTPSVLFMYCRLHNRQVCTLQQISVYFTITKEMLYLRIHNLIMPEQKFTIQKLSQGRHLPFGLMYFADSQTGLADSRTELETAFIN